jgi:intracellular septation protein A
MPVTSKSFLDLEIPEQVQAGAITLTSDDRTYILTKPTSIFLFFTSQNPFC